MKNVCPSCGDPALLVIYLGLPMKLCPDQECGTLWGFWSYVPVWLPITSDGGWSFFIYGGQSVAHACSYPKALWAWLCGTAE